MFIKTILGTGEVRGYPKRTMMIGKYKNYSVVVDNFLDKNNKVIEKRFVWWNDFNQWIVNKKRNSKGRFERYW